MPELPEVETVKRGLAPWLEGAKITDILVRNRSLRYPISHDFESMLEGSEIHKLSRRAKYILIETTRCTLIVHLGMSGSMRKNESQDLEKHDHVIIHTNKAMIVYNDPRRFGAMVLATGDPSEHDWLKNLGPEPFGNAFHADHLRAKSAGKRQNVKTFLLDQHHVAGIGNIYASEILWRAQINPNREASRLSHADCEHLVTHTRQTLQDAIDSGGSSLRDHRQVDGKLGYFQHHFSVYGKEGKACERSACGGVIEKQVIAQRSTYFCARCQN